MNHTGGPRCQFPYAAVLRRRSRHRRRWRPETLRAARFRVPDQPNNLRFALALVSQATHDRSNFRVNLKLLKLCFKPFQKPKLFLSAFQLRRAPRAALLKFQPAKPAPAHRWGRCRPPRRSGRAAIPARDPSCRRALNPLRSAAATRPSGPCRARRRSAVAHRDRQARCVRSFRASRPICLSPRPAAIVQTRSS